MRGSRAEILSLKNLRVLCALLIFVIRFPFAGSVRYTVRPSISMGSDGVGRVSVGVGLPAPTLLEDRFSIVILWCVTVRVEGIAHYLGGLSSRHIVARAEIGLVVWWFARFARPAARVALHII
jgi:hypothetical protein